MPKFHVVVPHALSTEEATERLNRFAEMLSAQYGDQVSDLQQSWEGNRLNFRFKTYGIGLSGDVNVAEHQLEVDGDLPFSAMMFKGKIESSIRDQLQKLMS